VIYYPCTCRRLLIHNVSATDCKLVQKKGGAANTKHCTQKQKPNKKNNKQRRDEYKNGNNKT